jgi:hypothetical protein
MGALVAPAHRRGAARFTHLGDTAGDALHGGPSARAAVQGGQGRPEALLLPDTRTPHAWHEVASDPRHDQPHPAPGTPHGSLHGTHPTQAPTPGGWGYDGLGEVIQDLALSFSI